MNATALTVCFQRLCALFEAMLGGSRIGLQQGTSPPMQHASRIVRMQVEQMRLLNALGMVPVSVLHVCRLCCTGVITH
jgi:hypothetical protein